MGEFFLNRNLPTQHMIMDSCVLIDFMFGDPTVFSLIRNKVGTLYVASPIIEEVDSIKSLQELEDLDLVTIEPEIEDVFSALEMSGKTSFQDNICYLTAKRNNLTCISNDKNLRKLCKDNGVPILWGLELLLILTRAGGISKKEAIRIADNIHYSNPRHINKHVISSFIAKLNHNV